MLVQVQELSQLNTDRKGLEVIEPWDDISNNVVCATSKGSEPLLVAWIFYEC